MRVYSSLDAGHGERGGRVWSPNITRFWRNDSGRIGSRISRRVQIRGRRLSESRHFSYIALTFLVHTSASAIFSSMPEPASSSSSFGSPDRAVLGLSPLASDHWTQVWLPCNLLPWSVRICFPVSEVLFTFRSFILHPGPEIHEILRPLNVIYSWRSCSCSWRPSCLCLRQLQRFCYIQSPRVLWIIGPDQNPGMIYSIQNIYHDIGWLRFSNKSLLPYPVGFLDFNRDLRFSDRSYVAKFIISSGTG